MRLRLLSSGLLSLVLFVPTGDTYGQAAADSAHIVAAALDYIEGYYEGDAARMERSLHPDLAKRIVRTDPRHGRSHLGQMSALTLVQIARSKNATPTDERRQDVTILDAFGNVASVKVVAADWVDYLHIAKWNGEWKIVNVLWEMKPQDP